MSDIQVIQGDCLEIMKTFSDNQFDLVLTDPPYGKGQNIVAVGECPAYKDDYSWNDAPPKQEYFDELIRVSKNQIVWGGNYFSCLWKDDCRGFLVWDKCQCSNNHADCEMAWTSYDRNAKLFQYCFSGNRFGFPSQIQGVGAKSNRVHPTQKPKELMIWCLKQAGDVETVLDPFAGSGTTGVACEALGIDCTLIEINEKYYQDCQKRVQEEKDKMGLFNGLNQ